MIRPLLALAILLTPATADVFTVDSSGGADFTEIQTAIDSTSESDVILVNAGTYPGFTVTNQTVRVIGLGSVSITGPISLHHILGDNSVALSGLHVATSGLWAIAIRHSTGAIRLQSMSAEIVSSAVFAHGPLIVEDSDNVSLVNCDVSGGQLSVGLEISDSKVASAQSSYRGGSDSGCTFGQDGIRCTANSFLFDSASFAVGGEGGSCGQGDGCGSTLGLDGGDGISQDLTSQSILLQTVLMGGLEGLGHSYQPYYNNYSYVLQCYDLGSNSGLRGAPAPGPSANTSAPTFLTGTARRSSCAATVLEGGDFSISVEGELGDQVSLLLSKSSSFDENVTGTGVRLVGVAASDPSLYREIPLGTLTTPTMDFVATFPLETSDFKHDTWFAQTLFTAADQSLWYGPGRTLTVLDDPESFDPIFLCNGDGGDQLSCTDCPCGNNALAGTIGGCLNSSATSARLHVIGSRSVTTAPESTHDLRISVTGAPPTSFCRLVSGSAVAPGGMANPCFGLNSGVQSVHFDGLRCAISGILRHGGRSADANGEIGASGDAWGGEGAPNIGLARQHGFSAGQSHFFQMVNRDFPNLSCMTGLNTTQAVEITFTP